MPKKFLSNKFRKELTVGEKIRKIRKRKQIMLKDLASECGVTSKAMQNYEAGERQVTPEKIDLIAEKLGVSPASICYKFESIGDFCHFLFEAEREGLIIPVECSEDTIAQFSPFGLRTSDEVLNEALKAWHEERKLLDTGQISDDDYLNWQDAFPYQFNEDDTINFILPDGTNEISSDAEETSKFKQNGYLRLCSQTDHAINGMNGTIVPQNVLARICKYTNCTLDFLNDEGIIEFSPNITDSDRDVSDSEPLFDILGILDRNADTEHYRTVQIQLSRIAFYYLHKKGFDRDAFRMQELLQSKLDYLYTGQKSHKKSKYFGLNFSELGIIRERTGISFKEMFTGIE